MKNIQNVFVLLLGFFLQLDSAFAAAVVRDADILPGIVYTGNDSSSYKRRYSALRQTRDFQTIFVQRVELEQKKLMQNFYEKLYQKKMVVQSWTDLSEVQIQTMCERFVTSLPVELRRKIIILPASYYSMIDVVWNEAVSSSGEVKEDDYVLHKQQTGLQNIYNYITQELRRQDKSSEKFHVSLVVAYVIESYISKIPATQDGQDIKDLYLKNIIMSSRIPDLHLSSYTHIDASDEIQGFITWQKYKVEKECSAILYASVPASLLTAQYKHIVTSEDFHNHDDKAVVEALTALQEDPGNCVQRLRNMLKKCCCCLRP